MNRRILPWLSVAVALSLPSLASALGGLTAPKLTCYSPPYCVAGSLDRPCCAYTNCVTCGFNLAGLGNVTKTDGIWARLGCQVDPSAGQPMQGLALCMNKGTNLPPGLQPASVDASWSGVDTIPADRNGKVSALISAQAPQPVLDALLAAGVCPNTNYEVVDFIPCDFQETLSGEKIDPMTGAVVLDRDGNPITVSKTFRCTLGTLPECYTLGYDRRTGVEKRPYACSCVRECEAGVCVDSCPSEAK